MRGRKRWRGTEGESVREQKRKRARRREIEKNTERDREGEKERAIESKRKGGRERERPTLQAGEVGILRFSLQQVREASVPVAEATALQSRKKHTSQLPNKAAPSVTMMQYCSQPQDGTTTSVATP